MIDESNISLIVKLERIDLKKIVYETKMKMRTLKMMSLLFFKKWVTELNWFNTIILKFYLWHNCDWNACNKIAKSKYSVPHE